METREEAIKWLQKEGRGAVPLDAFGPGAFIAATGVEKTELGDHLLGDVIVFFPSGNGCWDMKMLEQDKCSKRVIEPKRFASLDDALSAVSKIMCQGT